MSVGSRRVGAWEIDDAKKSRLALPTLEVAETTKTARSSNLLQFVLFALLPLNTAVPGASIPISESAAVVLVLLATLRRPVLARRVPLAAQFLVTGVIATFFVSAYVNDLFNQRRLGHMLIYGALIVFLASGRLEQLAAVRGIAVGLGLAVASGYINLVVPIFAQGYDNRLTGLLADPNAAGYYFLVLGCLAFVGLKPTRWRIVAVLFVAAAILLTQSRTTTVALGIVAAWLLVRRLNRPTLALPIFALTFPLFSWASEKLRYWGPFAERGGSDALRDRIEAAEALKVAQHPWIGNGPGTSTVDVGPRSFFFHSSWLGVRNEIGWIGFALVVALMAFILLRLLRLSAEHQNPWYEAAILASALCALNLGEVVFELNVALVLGLALRHTLAPHELRAPPDPAPEKASVEHVG